MKQALCALIVFGLAACERSPQPPQLCQLERGCTINVNGETVTVRSDRAPQPTRPFVLKVTAPRASQVNAQFEMRGMSMATPEYRLAQRGAQFDAKIILPVCVSGRSDWVLTLTVDGKSAEVGFSALS